MKSKNRRSTNMKSKNGMRPIHPGEILREEYLVPLDMSANALAQALGVPANRISAIVAGERGVTADTALRLARAFGTTPEFWLNLQQSYELRRCAAAATEVPRAIVVTAVHHIEGQMVIETTCANYDAYLALPHVVEYEGKTCGLTGWSSDRNYACYKSGVRIARG